MAILIKNARVFAPKDLGVVDVLMANERILAVGKDLAPNLPDLQTVEAGGMIMTPGFFDHLRFGRRLFLDGFGLLDEVVGPLVSLFVACGFGRRLGEFHQIGFAQQRSKRRRIC